MAPGHAFKHVMTSTEIVRDKTAVVKLGDAKQEDQRVTNFFARSLNIRQQSYL